MDSNDFIIDTVISFHKLIDYYRQRIALDDSTIAQKFLKKVVDFADERPHLENGFKPAELDQYKDDIRTLLSDLFPQALTLNEIKAVTIPFSEVIFNRTDRFKNILHHAGEDFDWSLFSNDSMDYKRMAYGIILNIVYGKSLDISRPILTQVPDGNGAIRTYRATYNADFMEVVLLDKSKRLEESQIRELLRNPEDNKLWASTFSRNVYQFKGFGILTLTDVTIDNAISDLKTILLTGNKETMNITVQMRRIFSQIFNLEDLGVGFTAFDPTDENFEARPYGDTPSYIIADGEDISCKAVLCHESHTKLLEDFTPLVISDITAYREKLENPYLADRLLEQDIHSAILFPIYNNKKLMGVLELVSKEPYELNSFNMMKLDGIISYLKASLLRINQEYENSVKALIQTECTSIHPSVQWKFEQHARQLLRQRRDNDNRMFKDIRFQDVSPLFGQIDIVGSSDARNEAIKNDLITQLKDVGEIFAFAKANEPLPIYDQICLRVSNYEQELHNSVIDANSEREILDLLKSEINPVMKHIKVLSKKLKSLVAAYQDKLDYGTGAIYSYRNDYDEAVQYVNEHMARYIDHKQRDAQEIFPHFFERFKTDGVEHNIYVGESIAKNREYNPVYLYNLRLWQLQTMCEMENQFYKIQQDSRVHLNAASLILVFDNTLSIRYRIDEKRFDVDGTYNARYEVVKKRIDKALIKGTDERITQKGKLTIVYTNKENEKEYKRYLTFLQEKKYIDYDLEVLELEDVQGVIGLKALRVGILYNIVPESDKRLTYNDLITEQFQSQ